MDNKVQLITYAKRFGEGTISSLTDILRSRFSCIPSSPGTSRRLRTGRTCVPTMPSPCSTPMTASA